MTNYDIVVESDLASVSHRVIADLIPLITSRTSAGADFHLSLTGGRLGNQIIQDLCAEPTLIDNPRLHLWFSDERFVPQGHADRNDLPISDEARAGRIHVHSIPGPDSAESVQSAASQYAQDLHLATTTRFCATNTLMDVTVLGVGPDGHVASLFPHSVQLESVLGTIAVTDSPKPPPVRVTWTYPTLNASEQVWIVATGSDKTHAIQSVLDRVDYHEIPATRIAGRQSTRIMVDSELAADLKIQK